MGKKRLLLLLKPFHMYTASQSTTFSSITNPKVLRYLDSRCTVHKHAIEFCQDILRRKFVDWDPVFRRDLSQPIRDVDLVVTIGGDGTVLHASHFIDDSVPVLGVNSDPTRPEEVQEFSDEFDATRSTGYLCAGTVENFEEILDNILKDRSAPSELSRMSISVNSKLLPTYALNDVLIAHPCPATVSRFSFRIMKDSQLCSPLVNCRSSGLRVSTAAGSTAAILSAGGFAMPILSKELQYMVREPILSVASNTNLMQGVVKSDESMDIAWHSKEGLIYIDGSHVVHPVKHGDTVVLSSKAPILKAFLPRRLLQ